MFIDCGIATRIVIEKEYWKTEEILESIKNEIDLSIYNVIDEENYIFLEMKKDIFEKNAVDFIKEQLSLIVDKKGSKERIEELRNLENKSYEELMEIANYKKYISFQFVEGCRYSNDISYIAKKFYAYADVVSYISDGKVFFECYSDIFYYLRKTIIANSKNPIRTAAVITIIG